MIQNHNREAIFIFLSCKLSVDTVLFYLPWRNSWKYIHFYTAEPTFLKAKTDDTHLMIFLSLPLNILSLYFTKECDYNSLKSVCLYQE